MADPEMTRRRSRSVRPVAALLAATLLLGGAAVLASYALGEPGRPTAAAAMTGADLRRTVEGDLARGQEVFLRDCAWCHGPEGEGTQNGPTLETSGTADADFWLRTGRMPLTAPDVDPEPGPPAYDSETIDALVGYVDTLGVGDPIPVLGPGDPTRGRTVFLVNCAACHSSSGTGVIVSGGEDAPELWDSDGTQVAEAVRIGPNEMPAFPPSQLDDQEIDDLVAYVDDLGEEQVESGLGLEQYGPIAEGFVVWLVLLPVLVLVIVLLGKRAPR
jgi:ubiquinol-cytochrome c reductase cytochrome c subunit